MASRAMMGRVPPNDVEAEKALLGLLIQNSKLIDEIQTMLRPDDFYQKGHVTIFAQLLLFKQKNFKETLDLRSFVVFLTNEGKIEECGGLSYLIELTNSEKIGFATNAAYYAQTIRSLSRRRKLIDFTADLHEKAFDISEDIQGVIDHGEQRLSDLNSEGGAGADYKDLKQVLTYVTNNLKPLKKGESEGVSSGFDLLDDLTGGFRKQELTIIGARPSVGKTAFALSMALNMVMRNTRVGFFSLEMTATSLGQRLISQLSDVDFALIRKRLVNTGAMMDAIMRAAGTLYEKQLYIQDTPNMKLMDLRAQARRMKLKNDVQIIFIDYIGLIEYEDQSLERFNQVSQISRSLKQLARELDIPIICLCQVNRQAEGVEPKLSDLRDSGSIEQDADQVILLHRDKMKEKQEDRNAIQETKLIMAKNRNGETGTFTMGFKGNVVKFVPLDQSRRYTPGNSNNV
jgi:replicative DNA helicase